MSIHSELEDISQIFAWVFFIPVTCLAMAMEAFFGSYGLSRPSSHLQYKSFCVNQLLSYCITFLPEADKH